MTRVELDIFSGRQNPAWEMDPAQESELQRRLAHLPASSAKVRIPDLGYRGIIVASQGGSYLRFLDSHVLEGREAPLASYLDQGRQIERWLLETGARSIDPPVYQHVRGLL